MIVNILGIDASSFDISWGILFKDPNLKLRGVVKINQIEHLPSYFAEVLQLNQLKLNQLDGIALVTGPGNYTSLRGSILMANTLSLVKPLKLFAQNKLELLLYAIQSKENLMVSQYVRMGQYYVGIGRYDGNKVQFTLDPMLVSTERWLELQQAENCQVFGEAPGNFSEVKTVPELGLKLAEWSAQLPPLQRLKPFYIRDAVMSQSSMEKHN